MTVVWNGGATEYRALVDAVSRNCDCEFGWGTRRMCAAHRMLAEDQRALDGLLFARRLAERLRREEGMAAHEAPAGPNGARPGVTAVR
jgi:hypothetical protein